MHPYFEIYLIRAFAFAFLFVTCCGIDWLAWEWQQTWRQGWGGVI